MSSSMDEEEVTKQLDHMVKFIFREAEEKALELGQKAKEELSIERQKIVQEEKEKLRKEYDKKERRIERENKIKQSNYINENRLKVLQARDEYIDAIFQDAKKKLFTISQDQQTYKRLLHDLILQGLLRLQEPKVSVVCRKEDLSLVKDVMKEAGSNYTAKLQKTVEVSHDDSVFLPSGTDPIEQRRCSGGVILSAQDGKIIVSNTLDVRLQMTFEQTLPQARFMLFGASASRVHFD